MNQEQLTAQLNATKARAFDLMQELEVTRTNYMTLERALVKIAELTNVDLSEQGSLDKLIAVIESVVTKGDKKKGD